VLAELVDPEDEPNIARDLGANAPHAVWSSIVPEGPSPVGIERLLN